MVGKIFLVLFALSFISQICSNPLTKEIKADQSPQLKFRDLIAQIQRTDIPAEVISSIFVNFEGFYTNLANLLQSQSRPNISSVLDVFNGGFGVRLLVVNEEYFQVDPDAAERLFLEKALFTVKSMFPKDPFQQFIVYAALQNQILRTAEEVRPEIVNARVPFEKFTAVVEGEPTFIGTRATNSTDILSQLSALLQTAVCDNVVSALYSGLNATLSTATTYLNSITISSDSDNALTSIIANLVSLAVDLGKQGIAYVQELVESFISSICSDLISSRKRRDLSVLQDLVGRSKRDTALARVGTQAVGVRDFNVVFALIMSVIAAVVTYILVFFITGGISSIISALSSFVLGSISSWASNIISSIFSFSWLSWW